MKNIEQVRRVAIVGTGIMGTGIALAFARAGYQTAAVDTRQENLDRARKTALNACRELVNDGLLKESQVDAVLKNLSLTLDSDQTISQADFIVEAVPEVLAGCGKSTCCSRIEVLHKALLSSEEWPKVG